MPILFRCVNIVVTQQIAIDGDYCIFTSELKPFGWQLYFNFFTPNASKTARRTPDDKIIFYCYGSAAVIRQNYDKKTQEQEIKTNKKVSQNLP